MSKKIWLWAAPLIFIGVLFYWPLLKIIGVGLSANWFEIYFEPSTLKAIWFTIWQAAVSTLIALLIGVPGAYVLYRKQFFGQRVIRALITVPLVLPTIVVAIVFSSFRAEHQIYQDLGLGFFFENSIYWIIAAHVFVNYSLVVRTLGGVWATMDNETEEAAALAGAGRLRTTLQVTLPQLKPAIVSASALTFLFCSSSYGIILILGGGQVQSVETQIATAALQFLDLNKAAALALLQTLITVVAFSISEAIAKHPIGIEQVDESTRKPRLDARDWPAVAVTALAVVGMIAIPMLVVLAKAFTFDGALSLQNFLNLTGRGDRELLNISIWQAIGEHCRGSRLFRLILALTHSPHSSRTFFESHHRFAFSDSYWNLIGCSWLWLSDHLWRWPAADSCKLVGCSIGSSTHGTAVGYSSYLPGTNFNWRRPPRSSITCRCKFKTNLVAH
ncbi:MAG: hypothetical protein RL570_636 [Actinomycetota bacterium]